MISNETLNLYLFPFRVASVTCCNPFYWNRSQQRFVLSHWWVKRALADACQIVSVTVRTAVLGVILYNFSSQFHELETKDKVVGILVAALVFTTTTFHCLLMKFAMGAICFVNGLIQFHQHWGRVWRLDPKDKDGAEGMFTGIILAGFIVWLLTFPVVAYVFHEQQDKFFRYIASDSLLENVALAIVAAGPGFGFDLLIVGCTVFTLHLHFFYSWKWLKKLSWHPCVTHGERRRIPLQYRGLQILHTTLMESGRPVYPSIAVVCVILLNNCLYCVIRYYTELSRVLTVDLLILSTTVIGVFKMFCSLLSSFTAASVDLGPSYGRNMADNVSRLNKRLFRSYAPLTTTYEYLFTFKRNTFLQVLRYAIIDMVVTALLTFR